MTDTVQTLRGPIQLDEIRGTILPHEHLLIDYGDLTGAPREPVTEPLVDELCARLTDAHNEGVDLLVDCTPPSYGRYLDVMRVVSERTGVHIVAATGSFCEAWAPLPSWVRALELDELADQFVRELRYGAGATSWSAGVVKAATGPELTRNEERVLRAAARASAATGACIVSHTTGGLGGEQLDIYEAEGVPPRRVLISHVGFEEDPHTYVEQLTARGAYVGLDRIGHHHFHPDEHWVALLGTLREIERLDRALLSHDAVTRFSGPAEIGAHTFSDYTYLSRTFLPLLERSGFSRAEIDLLVNHNPRRWLSGEEEQG
jgi:predicted metal-dependent phosphotriesterase family hydrolase